MQACWLRDASQGGQYNPCSSDFCLWKAFAELAVVFQTDGHGEYKGNSVKLYPRDTSKYSSVEAVLQQCEQQQEGESWKAKALQILEIMTRQTNSK